MNDLTIDRHTLFPEAIEIVSDDDSTSGTTTEGLSWRVVQGDAHTKLKELDDEHFGCCVTSPPYFWLRDYGVDGQSGHEESVSEYVNGISDVMDEVFKKLKKNGLLFLNLGDTYYSGKGKAHGADGKSTKRRFGLRAVDKSGGLDIGIARKSMIGIPWRVAIEMMKRGWVLRSSIIWYRHKALPEFVIDRPRRNYEFVFMFAKDRFYHFNREPLTLDKNVDEDVWTIVPRPRDAAKLDTAPFPDELVERCLAIGCEQEAPVLDPYAGSGTTLRVALKTGRPATGVELNGDFCKHIIEELRRY